MALQTTAGAPPASRKLRRLGIAVVIVVALYSAGWFFVASKIETFLKGYLGGAGPVDIECPGLATSGFPFLIGFTCDKTEIGDSRTGDSLTAGALRVAARIYSPGSAVVELDDDHEGIGDHAMGRVFVLGTLVGVPATWAVGTVLMLPWGLAVAAPAAIFVGIASGPFFGAGVFLMAKILRQESQGR